MNTEEILEEGAARGDTVKGKCKVAVEKNMQ